MPSDTTVLRRTLAASAIERFPRQTAALLEQHPPAEIAATLEHETPTRAGAVLSAMRTDIAADVVAAFSEDTFRSVLPETNPVQSARWLARMDEETRHQRLRWIEESLARELDTVLSYPPGTAGSLMDPRFSVFRKQTTAREALIALQGTGRKRIYQVLVIDDDGKLVGAVPLADLAVEEPSTAVGDLVTDIPSVSDTSPRSEVVDILEQHRLPSLPVIDFHGKLVGVIRHDALVRAAASEATANIQTMVGASREEGALSPAFFAVRKRLPWLQINLLTAFLAAGVVGLFEGTIARFTALAVLMPVAAGQSGNTGAQALAVTMRGLALREIRVRHWLRIVAKELGVGGLNGIAVAGVTAAAVYVWSDSTGLAAVIGIAMVVSMVIASVAGALVPIGLTILKQDPAQASSIILTTVTDIVGFVSFLGLATLLSGLL